MKKFNLLIALLLMCQLTFAQYENFDLSKYKLPDIKRHQLDLNFNSNGSILNLTDYYYDPAAKSESKTSQFLGGGEFGYSFYSNTARFQTTGEIQTYLNYSKNKHSYSDSNTEASDFANYFTFSYNFKYFMGNKQWFLTAIPHSNISYNRNKDFVDETESNYRAFSGDLGLGGGIGRIEQVQDYRHGILLLQELEKRGVAKQQLSEDEVRTFSALISELKNKRVFDARLRKQNDLESIHEFLVRNGVVDEKMDINYFVGLEDIWMYGSLQIRESGKQLQLITTPFYTSRKNENDDSNGYKLDYFELVSSLKYQIFKPLSLKWQTDYDFGIVHRYTDKITEEDMILFAKKHYSVVYSNVKIGFFPNTRTYFNLSGALNLSNSSNETLFDDERYVASVSLYSSAYYYISERLRLNGSMRFESTINGIFNNKIENSKFNYFSYSLGLNYAIF